MQRVHNVTPPPEEDGRNSAKARKRKTDPTAKNSSGRKSPKSRKSSPKAELPVIKIDPAVKLREDWFAAQTGLATTFSGLANPEDPSVMTYINRAKEELESLTRIYMELMATTTSGCLAQPSG